jgi:plasmid stabilization system protein ParE
VTVRVTKQAESDIAQAFEWYEQQKPDLGYRFMARVDEAIEQISQNPKAFAPVIGAARHVLVDQFPYAIWYTVEEDAIVIACLHSKRDQRLVNVRAAAKPEP